jgi:FAD/FMN-containing dehydrogenase
VSPAELLTLLQQRLGPAGLLTQGELGRWERDWRGRWPGKALAVARPVCSDEVAQVVRLCASAGVAIVPQGGNTGLVGGGVPDASGQQLLLSLERLRQIRQVDATNLSLDAEAGCTLAQVQQAAQDAGLLYPLSLASEGSCTVGGTLATNAGGTQVLRYGNARELCLGLEVVTPQGDIWQGLGGLRKNNSGYDLRDLFIGSEGTLGIITAATLKLFARPGGVCTALAGLASVDQAVQLLHRAQHSLAAGLTGFELMSAHALSLVATHCPQLPQPLAGHAWVVLLEFGAADDAAAQASLATVLAQAMAQGGVENAVVAGSPAQAQALWQLRESISQAQAAEGLNIKHDIALPLSAIADFVRHTDAALKVLIPGVRPVTFGHLGDGNLHYNVQAPVGWDPAAFLREQEAAVNALVYDAVVAAGGSISAEHGIGVLKRDELAARKSPVAMALMRQLKAALDPQATMNPGRLL